jgi:predicted RNA binding protein YcfA (HicA-like mRNA interferase family)
MSSWPSAKARRVFAALKRIGWRHDRTVGSHKIMKKDGWADYPFSSTIPRNLVLPSWRKSRKRRVYNPKTCDGAASPTRSRDFGFIVGRTW